MENIGSALDIYREKYPEVSDSDLLKVLHNESWFGIGQMILCLVMMVVAFFLLKINRKYHSLASILIIGVQILDIPFVPFLPAWFILTLSFNQFGLIFFLPMVVSDNLLQVFVAYTTLFVSLAVRLHLNFGVSPHWGPLVFFYLMNTGISICMVTNILGNCKLLFAQRYEMTMERDDFKEILG